MILKLVLQKFDDFGSTKARLKSSKTRLNFWQLSREIWFSDKMWTYAVVPARLRHRRTSKNLKDICKMSRTFCKFQGHLPVFE